MPLAIKFSGGLIVLTVLTLSAWSYVFGGGGDSGPSVDQREAAQVDAPDEVDADPNGLQGAGKAAGAGNATGDSPPYTVQSVDTLGTLVVHVSIAPGRQAAWINGVLRLASLPSAPSVHRDLVLPAVATSEALEVTAPVTPDSPGQGPESPLPLGRPSSDEVIPTPTSTPPGRTYTVMSGDTAASIAAKHCAVDPPAWIEELLDTNDVQEDGLTAGIILELPEATPLLCPTPTPGARSPSLAPVAAAATATPTPARAP